MTPKIIFEDNEILVLDKPAGITVNKSDTTVGEKTVQGWVEEKFKIQPIHRFTPQGEKSKIKIDEETDFYKRAGIVHRIDKETSGILLVAKTLESFTNLQAQFKERKVKKTYIALVHGKVIPENGEINVPVGRLPWNRKRFGIVAEGKKAVTRYQVLSIMYQALGKNKEPLTLLELYPESGRTHQIRVHLKYLNHPIFADSLYAGRKTARNDRKLLPHVFLHASKISFYHPKRGKEVSFVSQLPEELTIFLKTLSNE